MSGMVRYCSIQNVDSGKWLFESTDKSGHENKVETGNNEYVQGDLKASICSRELIMIRNANNGFISADKRIQLLDSGIQEKELEKIRANCPKLLGGMFKSACTNQGFVCNRIHNIPMHVLKFVKQVDANACVPTVFCAILFQFKVLSDKSIQQCVSTLENEVMGDYTCRGTDIFSDFPHFLDVIRNRISLSSFIVHKEDVFKMFAGMKKKFAVIGLFGDDGAGSGHAVLPTFFNEYGKTVTYLDMSCGPGQNERFCKVDKFLYFLFIEKD